MSSNFSLYFDSLLDISRGEPIDEFSDKIVENLYNWGYIEVFEDEVIVTRKGLNILEFYQRNNEFMKETTSKTRDSVVLTAAL